MLRIIGVWLVTCLATVSATAVSTVGAEMQADEAWKALPKYEYGQDMAPLLVIDQEVIRAMATPATRAACAARLAAVLEAADTTPAARQYICCQLRQVGTAAEVPCLARHLADPDNFPMVREALESIPGEESLAALRDGLNSLQGDALVGVINSVAARRDARSVAKLEELAGGEDGKVAAAALWALGNIASPEAVDFVEERVKNVSTPMPEDVAVPLLRCADALAAAGKADQARAIYTRLSNAEQPVGIRRGALLGILELQKDEAAATILAWIGDPDADRRAIAAGRLATLPKSQFGELMERAGELPEAVQGALIEVLAAREGSGALEEAMSAARSDKPELKLAGIRALSQIGDERGIPVLVDALQGDGAVVRAAQEALCLLPSEPVGSAMRAALNERPEIRGPVLEVLKRLRCYAAIDSLIVIASEKDPNVYGPALDALRTIADPDDSDIPRLLKLLLSVEAGRHREEVERTVVIVCGKLPPEVEHAKPVLEALAKIDAAEPAKYLPLLGKLGGPEALAMIDASLKSDNPELKDAAVRALCNWPNAAIAERLWDMAGQSENAEYRSWALRAYVRVVTLKSDRPEAETLAMLQEAMKQADNLENRQWIVTRAATIRTMDTVQWLAGYLDDPGLAQAACHSLVELAHHRFLRHPNMKQFEPILEKVSKLSKDPAVVERAKKYRLGL